MESERGTFASTSRAVLWASAAFLPFSIAKFFADVKYSSGPFETGKLLSSFPIDENVLSYTMQCDKCCHQEFSRGNPSFMLCLFTAPCISEFELG